MYSLSVCTQISVVDYWNNLKSQLSLKSRQIRIWTTIPHQLLPFKDRLSSNIFGCCSLCLWANTSQLVSTANGRISVRLFVLWVCIALSLQFPDRPCSAWEDLNHTGQLLKKKKYTMIKVKNKMHNTKPVSHKERLWSQSTTVWSPLPCVALHLSLNQGSDWVT